MEHLIRMGLLFEFYAPLLTEKQQRIARAYYHHNLSLGEIAETEGITRQAVHDLVHRTEELLLKYEERLHLMDAHQERSALRKAIVDRLKILDGLTPLDSAEARQALVGLQRLIEDWTVNEEEQEEP